MGVVLVALVLVDGQAVVVVAAGDFVGRLICRVDQVVGGVKGKAFVAGLGQAAKGVVAVMNGLLCAKFKSESKSNIHEMQIYSSTPFSKCKCRCAPEENF